MRVLIRTFAVLNLISVVFAGQPEDKAQKTLNGKIPAAVAPKKGIKTPGVQIPFSSLKAEATISTPDQPSWAFLVAGRPGALYVPAKDKLDKIDPKTNKPAEGIAGLKKPCGGMVSAFSSFWVATCGDGSLQRIDAKTAKVTVSITTGTVDAKGSLAASADSVWLLTDKKETLSRIDPEQNAVVGELRIPSGCGSLAFGETSLWLVCPDQNRVLRVNPATNLVDKRIEVSAHPVALAIGEGSVWVLCGKDGKIDRIDPKTDKVAKSIDLMTPGVTDGGIAVGDGFVWVTMTGFPLTRINPTSETVAQQFWGEGGGAIYASPGALWLSNLNSGTLLRIDPKLVLATLAE